MSGTESKKSSFKLAELLSFFKSRIFVYNLIRLGLFLLLLWILHGLLLNLYTNHGQKVKMANYIGLPLTKVERLAAAKDYELMITDSVHLIGKPGGYVLNQIPKQNSLVKRGRKVYLVISRYKADEIISDNLPTLYGEKFEFKNKEFDSQFQLKLRITGNKYDPGPSGHILEARYKGELIADENSRKLGVLLSKGDTIDVIISVSQGGEIDLPNLRCKTLAEARFEIEASGIKLGNITQDGEIPNLDDAYIISQSPAYEKSKKIKMESSIDLTLSQTYPDDCEPR